MRPGEMPFCECEGKRRQDLSEIALEHFRTNMNQFDGNKSVFRVGAVRSAMPLHRASAATPPGDRFDPPKAGCFRCVDVVARLCRCQCIAMRRAPSALGTNVMAKSSRSNGSYLSGIALEQSHLFERLAFAQMQRLLLALNDVIAGQPREYAAHGFPRQTNRIGDI